MFVFAEENNTQEVRLICALHFRVLVTVRCNAQALWRPQLHVTGVIAHGACEVFFISDADVPKDIRTSPAGDCESERASERTSEQASKEASKQASKQACSQESEHASEETN